MSKRWLLSFLLFLGVAAGPGVAQATSVLQIIISGLDLAYDGTDIYDTGSILGGGGDSAFADPLDTMVFKVDGVTVGILTTFTDDIFADILIEDVFDIPVGGGTVVSGGNGDDFGFDLLTSTSVPGWGLALNIDEMEITFEDGSVSILGAGTASSVAVQSLPFGLVIDESQPIQIAFSGNASGVTDDGTFLTGFDSSGSGEVTAMLPEPTGLMLMALGLAGLAIVGRPRR